MILVTEPCLDHVFTFFSLPFFKLRKNILLVYKHFLHFSDQISGMETSL